MRTEDAIRYENLLQEAIRLGRLNQHQVAQPLLVEARHLVFLNAPAVRPEEDPSRSPADREAWRLARGA
jgi:hypothetical protein